MMKRLSELLLIGILIVVIGWPALAMIHAATTAHGTASGGGGGLMTSTALDLASGRVQRPLQLALTSLELVFVTEAIALPLGIPLALILVRTDAWGRRGMIALLGIAAFVPLPLHAAGWIGGFGNAGRMQAFGSAPLLVGLPGAAFVHAMATLPWIVLIVGVGLCTVESELEESALLEMPAWRVLIRVTLRRSVGAIAGAVLAVAVLTSGDMTVTDLLQIRTYAEEAYVQFQLGQGPAAAAVVAVPPLMVLGLAILVSVRALLRLDPARLASVARRARVWALGRWRVPLGGCVFVTAGNLLLLPVLTLLWRTGRVGGAAASGRSPSWSAAGFWGTLRRALQDVGGSWIKPPLETALRSGHWSDLRGAGPWLGPPLGSPLVESLVWGALGATGAVLLAWGLAWKGRRPGCWRWVSAICAALALATPGPVVGMSMVLAYRDWPEVYDTPLIIVFVFICRTFPYALLILWPAVLAMPREDLEVAAIEGASEWTTCWRVVVPSLRTALCAAWGVAFVLAIGELPAANLVAPPGTGLIAIEIWSLLHTGVESHLAGVALVMLAAIGFWAGLALAILRRGTRWGR